MDYRKHIDGSGMRRGVAAVAALAVALMLAACGGGGDASSPVSQADPQLPAAQPVPTRQQQEAAALAQATSTARAVNANPMRNERPRIAGN